MGKLISIRTGEVVESREDDAFLRKYLMGAPKNTVGVIRSLYWRHFIPAIRETHEFEELIDIWKNTLAVRTGKPLSARTISKIVSIYREWFHQRYGQVANTARIMRRITRDAPRRVVDHWTPDQAVQALETAYEYEREHLYDRLLFALHTGVRKEEMFALTVGSCLFKTNTIAICSDPDFDVTKSAKPRPLKMSNEVRDMLTRRCQGLGENDLVFGPTEYLDRLRNVCRIANIPFKRWHAMRHTFASTLLNSGVPLPVVSTLLGHANPEITSAVYWHCAAIEIDDSALPRRRSE